MIRLFIVGIDGKMGKTLCEKASEDGSFEVVGGLDAIACEGESIFTKASAVNIEFDVLIDFSRPESLQDIITLCKVAPKKPVVLATTGYNKSQLLQIEKLSKSVPVFLSGNMSFGIQLMQGLVAMATKNLWTSSSVEIIEKHHSEKVDAPSGTAKMLFNTIEENASVKNSLDKSNKGKPEAVLGRSDNKKKRTKNEVGIHSVRGGTVIGEHEVLFYCQDEAITISHSAQNRSVFALGALKAARFLLNKPPSLYSMSDLLV